MLRQAVRLFLEQHNRLTYSSLQGIIRRIYTLNISEAQIRNGNVMRKYSHNVCLRYVHSTAVYCNDKNNLKYKRSGNVEEKTQDGDQSGDIITDKHNDDVALYGKIVNYKDESEISVHKNELDLSNFIDELDSDANNDNHDGSFNNDEAIVRELVPLKGRELETVKKNRRKSLDLSNFIDELDSDASNDNHDDFFDDDEAVGRELVPLKGQELETIKKNHGKSLVTGNMYYKPKSITQSLLEEEEEAADIVSSETNFELARLEEEYNLDLAEKGQLKVPGVKKVEIPSLTDVGPIVNDSEVLQKLVQLGVDLSVVQKKGMIEDVLKMNFKKDVGPYIWTLKDIGVPADKLGEVFTRCPWIFQHDVKKLRVRIDYLRSKKFSKSDIENMIDKDPKFLLIPVEKVDAKLGFLQQEFRLTGKQVREKVSGLSKLIIAKPAVIKESKFYMKKFLGFTDRELKTIFLAYPKIFLKNVDHTSNAFNYLHNVMELPHELIAKTPIAMDTTRYFLENRHRFLVKCGRAQYDPTKPNYVSLHALLTAKEDIWCVEIAKASVAEYNQFLRTI